MDNQAIQSTTPEKLGKEADTKRDHPREGKG